MGIDLNLDRVPATDGKTTPEEGAAPRPLTQNPKTEARLVAVQGVYRHLLLSDSTGAILQTFDDAYLKSRKAHRNLFLSILEAVMENSARYQKIIEPFLSEAWRWERIGYVEQAILLCALAELDTHQKTPFKVILNEFLTIAHSYFDPPEVAFVNSVLDKAVPLLRG